MSSPPPGGPGAPPRPPPAGLLERLRERRLIAPLLVVAAAAVTAVVVLAVLIVVIGRDSNTAVPAGEPDRPGSSGKRPADDERPTARVATSAGELVGSTDGSVRHWRGVPYAAPPVGRLRWRAPQPVQPWDGARSALRDGPGCAQPEPYAYGDTDITMRADSSEDCLYLDVSRPDDGRRGLPVMVYLHGGGFVGGRPGSVDAMGDALVERGVVLVSVGYRLGRLGFFAHPALPGRVANFGLLDQVAALRWVRREIESFGGDGREVTIVGGSAGAMSVDALMAMPSARGLFRAAISQSAPGDADADTLAEARDEGQAAFPGQSAVDLRALPAEELMSPTFNVLAGDAPLIDAVLPRPSVEAFARGKDADVPYLAGVVSDEFEDGAFTIFGIDPVALRADLDLRSGGALATAYGDDLASDLLNDVVFRLPTVAKLIGHSRHAPTYRYEFEGVPGGATHGSDVFFTFDALDRAGPDRLGGEPTPAQERLADAVADYWVAFATTGRPEVRGLPRWPAVEPSAPGTYLELGLDGPVAHRRDDRAPRLVALQRAVG